LSCCKQKISGLFIILGSIFLLGFTIISYADNDLIEQLNTSEDIETRLSLIKKISLKKNKKTINVFINLLKDENELIRDSAFDALNNMGEEAVDPLLTALDDKERPFSLYAAEALGRIGDLRSLEPIVLKMSRNYHSYNGNFPVQPFKYFGSQAVDPLLKFLKDDSKEVRAVAAIALGEIESKKAVDALIWKFKSGNYYVSREALKSLGKIGDPKAIGPILSASTRTMDIGNLCGNRVTIRYVDALKDIGEIGIEELSSHAKDERYQIRALAIEALGEIGGAAAINPLILSLNDKNAFVRKVGARSVGKIKAKGSEEDLKRLMADQNLQVRIWAAFALSRIGNPLEINFLIEALEYDDLLTKAEAACALGETENGRTIGALVAFWGKSLKMEKEFKQKDRKGKKLTEFHFSNIGKFTPGELESAVRDSVGKVGTPAIKYIVLLLSNEDEYVRKKAAYFLESKKWEPKSKEEQVSLMVASKKWRECVKFGKKASTYLIHYLEDDYREIRGKIAYCLGEIGNESDAESLIPLLTDWHNRREIASVLTQLKWQPKETEERIYFWVASGNRSELKNSWGLTKFVLLKDIEAKDYFTIENALYAFIGIGNEEIIPELVKILRTKGNKTMAEAYLNCGHQKLRGEAEMWAQRHGYSVKAGKGASPIGWGKM